MDSKTLEKLARRWIEVWTDGDPTLLPLAENFEHVSPYGRICGRDRYLEMTVPMAKANVARLTVEDVIVSGNQAAVRYRKEGSSGDVVPACDWLRFEGDRLASVWAYFERPRDEPVR